MNLGTFKDPQTRKVLKYQDKDGDMQKFIKFNVTLKVYVHKGSLFWVTATMYLSSLVTIPVQIMRGTFFI
jgi:hypothetical protein